MRSAYLSNTPVVIIGLQPEFFVRHILFTSVVGVIIVEIFRPTSHMVFVKLLTKFGVSIYIC